MSDGLIHFRLPRKGDTHVAACCAYWCRDNSEDWSKVTCDECLKIHRGDMVRSKRGESVPAFFGHARTEWIDGAYRYVNTEREDGT